MPWLINAAQLDKFRKSQKNLIVFDASYYLPEHNRDARAEFNEKHIPDAQFFDITQFNDPQSNIPHTLINDETIISEKLGALGVRNDYKIIFYDNSPLHTACRALWMMKVFGHNPFQLYVLDGGLSAWLKYNDKTESGTPSISPKQYSARFQPQFIRTLKQIKENLNQPREQLIDMRHPIRYTGGPETRPGLRSGHIPGAFSFPYFTMFDNENCFKPLDKIRKQLEGIGMDLAYPIVSMCGSGLTATILDFVLDLMGCEHHAVYDGSWCEWGTTQLFAGENSLDERPVEDCLSA